MPLNAKVLCYFSFAGSFPTEKSSRSFLTWVIHLHPTYGKDA